MTSESAQPVDDNPDFATMFAALLAVMGHEVRTVHDGPTAVSVAAEYHPDAVFLDIGLPGMNGYEVARTFRKLPELADVALIAFTGYGQDDDRSRVREAGFDGDVGRIHAVESPQLQCTTVDLVPAGDSTIVLRGPVGN